jgi:primosomal protein N' (replication factor Y)
LACWKCGRQSAYDERCGHCGSELIGFGSTGAEYVEEHIKLLMPDVSVIRITGDVVKNEGVDQLIGLLNKPRTIIVGTQILSKFYGIGTTGRLILIGWEDFLRIAGYRAREHMRQTYCNLIDALRPTKVHLLGIDGVREPAEILNMNSEDFYKEELKQRRTAEFPPYFRLFLLRVDAPNKASALSAAQRVRSLIEKQGLQDHVVGEAVQAGERGRLTILLKGEESLLDNLIDELYKVRHVRVEADPPWV